MKTFLALISFIVLSVAHAWYWDGAVESFEEADQLNPPALHGTLWVGKLNDTLLGFDSKFSSSQANDQSRIRGSQVEDLLYYFDRIVTPYSPNTIVIYSGENDLDFGKSSDQVFQDFEKLISRIVRHTDAYIVWLLPKKSPARGHVWARVDELNSKILQKYSFNQRISLIDLNGLLGLPTTADRYFREDGIHLNQEAYTFLSTFLSRFLPRL